MIPDKFRQRISEDWLSREKDLRDMDLMLLKVPGSVGIKAGILITYSHWEGHFKHCASELLSFISEGIKRKLFKWTDVRDNIRQRILFCSYRKSSLSGQTQDTFISHLNALHEDRYAKALSARDEVIMIDDNLNSTRAEAICRNLGVDYTWCALKKVVIDERLVEHRNAFAHGSARLRSGDEVDFSSTDLPGTIKEIRNLIRETKNRFENAIVERTFIAK